MGFRCILALVAALLSCVAAPAAPPAGFVRDQVGGSFTDVVGALPLPDGRLLAWERSGIVWMVERDGTRSGTPVLDIHDEVGAWRDFGLLGLAVHPSFPSVPDVFLVYIVDRHHLMHAGTPSYDPDANDYYSATIGRVTRYSLDPAADFRRVVPGSRAILLGDGPSTGLPICHQSHSIGGILFGEDGTLLVSMGDSASYESLDVGGQVSGGYVTQALADGILRPEEDVGCFRSQLVDSLCGKVLRLDPATGLGVPGNPWFDPAAPAAPRSRAWALGLRNPFRMALVPGSGSHDPADARPGTLLVGDVGWVVWEELNVVTAPGQNFGWPVFEGQDVHTSYAVADTPNLDAYLPGCGAVPFRDLIRQDSLVPGRFVARCRVRQAETAAASPSAPVGATDYGFLDWGYRSFAGAGRDAWIEWWVEVPAATATALSFRYSNGGPGNRPLDLLVDGQVVQPAMPFPATGAWREWRVASSAPVNLSPGWHSIRIRATGSGGPNVDAMWLESSAPDLPASIPTFTHARPTVDWDHWTPTARTATFGPEGAALFPTVGTAGGAAGATFDGCCAIGGPRTGFAAWPEPWRSGLFFGDFTRGWIRAATTRKEGSCGRDAPDCRCHLAVTAVSVFDVGRTNLVGLFADPVNQCLYAPRLSVLERYRWMPGGSQPPTAAISVDRTYGPAPLSIAFDGSGSTDPEGGTLSYRWDFGDGSPIATGPTVTHAYSADPGERRGLTATLTVADPGGASASASIRIGVNETPPTVRIASLEDGQPYSMDGPTALPLRAVVSDAESAASEVACRWQVILHHDTHDHPEQPDPACTSVAMIDPLGCSPPSTFWYEVAFTATDPSGLSATDRVVLLPDCEGILRCPGDLDGDGRVAGQDLVELLARWGGGGIADLNLDGTVNGVDLTQLLGRWGACPP